MRKRSDNGNTRVAERLSETVRRQDAEYKAGAERPLGGYLGLLSTYGAFVGAGAIALRRHGLPDSLSWSDVALISVATHKLSRLLAKDPVTSPFRAPFTRFQGPAGEGELNEEVRASGAAHAVGELVTCPFCLGQWVATGFIFGLVLAPRATRLAATVFTALTASDFLQLAYAGAIHGVEG
ncbi:MAG TPA: DUF1360 domain-containing protein [Acidimicrobiales bacterium]|jgi:hypothetical protein|nr:DUF1360 domain-containing protein [Acidimicrobiales bacterium]